MIELFVEERIGALEFGMLSHEQKTWRVQFQPMSAAKAAAEGARAATAGEEAD
jgi:hypothetical protein